MNLQKVTIMNSWRYLHVTEPLCRLLTTGIHTSIWQYSDSHHCASYLIWSPWPIHPARLWLNFKDVHTQMFTIKKGHY